MLRRFNHQKIVDLSKRFQASPLRLLCSAGLGISESSKPHTDGLTRWPGISSPQAILRSFDWIGTISFASSGCITAGHMGLDIFGCAVVGTITAVGGGTIRDCMLNQRVFWMDEYEYILLCLATCTATLLCWEEAEKNGYIKEDGPLLWTTDTLGVGAFAVIGAQNAIRMHLNPVVCVLCGMFTATFGGVVRDTLTKRDVRILHSRSEVYATTALGGATVYMLTRSLGATPLVKVSSGVISAMLMRYSAAKYDIKLPLAPWNKKAL